MKSLICLNTSKSHVRAKNIKPYTPPNATTKPRFVLNCSGKQNDTEMYTTNYAIGRLRECTLFVCFVFRLHVTLIGIIFVNAAAVKHLPRAERERPQSHTIVNSKDGTKGSPESNKSKPYVCMCVCV